MTRSLVTFLFEEESSGAAPVVFSLYVRPLYGVRAALFQIARVKRILRELDFDLSVGIVRRRLIDLLNLLN